MNFKSELTEKLYIIPKVLTDNEAATIQDIIYKEVEEAYINKLEKAKKALWEAELEYKVMISEAGASFQRDSISLKNLKEEIENSEIEEMVKIIILRG